MQNPVTAVPSRDARTVVGRLSEFSAVLIIVTIFSGLAYLYPTTNGKVGLGFLKPSYIYYLGYAVAAIVVFESILKVSLPKMTPVIWFLGLMIFVTLLASGSLGSDAIRLRMLVLRLNYFLFIASCIIIFGRIERIGLVLNATRAVLFGVLILNILILVAPGIFPARMTPYAGRAGGLVFEPNCCALLATTAIPFMCLGARLPFRMLIYTAALGVVLTTFSRSGFIYWAVAVALSEFLPPGAQLRINGKQIAGIAVLALLWLVLHPFTAELMEGLINLMKPFLVDDTLHRLSGNSIGDTSSTERFYVASIGYDEFLKSPIFGRGLGYASAWQYQVSVHNMVIVMLVEYGVFGILLLLGFITSLLAMPKPYGIWACMLFVMTIPFVHYYFDLPCYGISFVLCWAASRFDMKFRQDLQTPRFERARPQPRVRVPPTVVDAA